MDQFITPFRRAVTTLVAKSGIPTYGYLPDDVAHLPCHVIGRPSMTEFIDIKGVMTMTLDVTLLGRRISDEDSQSELDSLADQLFNILGGTRNVKVDNNAHLRCTGMLPATVIVAGQEMPAYIATVSAELMSC